jgi:hypothetical protein
VSNTSYRPSNCSAISKPTWWLYIRAQVVVVESVELEAGDKSIKDCILATTTEDIGMKVIELKVVYQGFELARALTNLKN